MTNTKLTVLWLNFVAAAVLMTVVFAPALSFSQEHGGMPPQTSPPGKQKSQMGKGMSKSGQSKSGMRQMGGMEGMEMGGMSMEDEMMGGMPMEQEMSGMSGMEMMGQMSMPKMARKKGMGGMQMSSTLPGFPGLSHLYHVGSTGFFLDHPKEITLRPEQQSALNRIKEKSVLDQSTFDRQIEKAEQELWQLTAADSPDAAKIEAKVREIEKARSDQRLAFVRAVGEAAKVLTEDQRAAVLGTKPAASQMPH